MVVKEVNINSTMKEYIEMLMKKNESLVNENKELKGKTYCLLEELTDTALMLKKEKLKNEELEDENNKLRQKNSTVAEDELEKKALESKNKQLEKKLEELVLENAYLRKRDFSRIEKIVENRVNKYSDGVTVVIV